jgi:hypothetical protein
MSQPDNATEAERLTALIDQWHFEAFNGSVVARDVEIWNFVRTATEDLKQRVISTMPARAS